MPAVTITRQSSLGGMEEVVFGDPDDVCLHHAYTSALLMQGDAASIARARFIQTQLKLEGALSAEERRKLVGRERKLLRDHGKVWLGELSAWLCRGDYRFTMWRGWLRLVEAPELDAAFLAALARSPMVRLLKSLVIAHDQPGGTAALAQLLDSPLADTLTEFQLGEIGEGEVPAVVIRRLAEAR